MGSAKQRSTFVYGASTAIAQAATTCKGSKSSLSTAAPESAATTLKTFRSSHVPKRFIFHYKKIVIEPNDEQNSYEKMIDQSYTDGFLFYSLMGKTLKTKTITTHLLISLALFHFANFLSKSSFRQQFFIR